MSDSSIRAKAGGVRWHPFATSAALVADARHDRRVDRLILCCRRARHAAKPELQNGQKPKKQTQANYRPARHTYHRGAENTVRTLFDQVFTRTTSALTAAQRGRQLLGSLIGAMSAVP